MKKYREVSEKELRILAIIFKKKICSAYDIEEMMTDNLQFLRVIRNIHALEDKGLVKRTNVALKSFYQINPVYSRIVKLLIKPINAEN